MVERVEPLARFTPGGMAGVSPTARIARRRRDEGDEREHGRKDEHGADDAQDEDEHGSDGRPHVDVLA